MPSARRPDRMMEIDHIGVPMPHRRMPVRMAVRLGPFPALVLVLVMLVVNM